jgi:hypothetical protein
MVVTPAGRQRRRVQGRRRTPRPHPRPPRPAQGDRRHPPRPADRLLARRARPGRLRRPRPGLRAAPPLHRTPHPLTCPPTRTTRPQRHPRTERMINGPSARASPRWSPDSHISVRASAMNGTRRAVPRRTAAAAPRRRSGRLYRPGCSRGGSGRPARSSCAVPDTARRGRRSPRPGW